MPFPPLNPELLLRQTCKKALTDPTEEAVSRSLLHTFSALLCCQRPGVSPQLRGWRGLMQPPHSSTSGAQRWAPGRQVLPHFSPGQVFFHHHYHSERIQGQNDFSYSEREFVVPTRCLGREIQVARLCYSAWQGFKWCVSKLPTELQNYTELRQGSRGRETRWRVRARYLIPLQPQQLHLQLSLLPGFWFVLCLIAF